MIEQSFGDYFWKKIMETFGIYDIPEKGKKKQYKLYEIDDEDLNIDITTASKWSKDNQELYNQIKNYGYTKYICNKEYIAQIYTEIELNQQNIMKLDESLQKFRNLKKLILNENLINVLENLPQQISELYLFSNRIFKISDKMVIESLLYLGLGYNQLRDNSLEPILKTFPKLKSLDLSFNHLSNIVDTIDSLLNMKTLKILNLQGNPLCLIKNYRQNISQALGQLQYLDGFKVDEKKQSINQNQNQQQQASSPQQQQKPSIAQNIDSPGFSPNMKESRVFFQSQTNLQLAGFDEQYKMDMSQQTAIFSLQVQTLENVKGILLDPADFAENTDQKLLQSVYWLEIRLLSKIINTKESPILFANATTEEEKSRIDFEYNLSEACAVNEDFRDQVANGFIIIVFERSPVMIEDENGEKKPKLNQNNLPELKEEIVGMCHIQLYDWLKNSLDDKLKQNKQYLFPMSCISIPEFYYPLDNEAELIKKHYKEPEVQQPVQTEESKKDVKGGQKKDQKAGAGGAAAKKGDKKAAKKGGKEEVIEKKTVPLLNWSIIERQKIFENQNSIVCCIGQLLLAIKVELNPNQS